MEVAISGSNNGGSPFQREVREWQRIDPNTGALLTGRLEADRWINGSLNSYGKVVDSQNVTQPNGTQHSQRKQLEVLQARTSSGSMQVIRAHTVQTKSSRWTAASSSSASSSNSSSPAVMATLGGSNNYFLSSRLNPGPKLKSDITAANSEISKNDASIITDTDYLTNNVQINLHSKQRQQHLLSTAPSLKLSNLMRSKPSVTNGSSRGSENKDILHSTKNNNGSPPALNRSLCHPQKFLTSSSIQQTNNLPSAAALLQQTSSTSSLSSTSTVAPTVPSRQITTTSSGTSCYDNSRYDLPTMTEGYVGGSYGGGRNIDTYSCDIDDDVGVGEQNYSEDRLSSSASRCQNLSATMWQPAMTLQRGRSISTDDLSTKNVNSDGVGGENDDDEPAEWRRVSKIRRSFQFPSTSAPETTRSRPTVLIASSVSVSKIRDELENGRRLSTAMRNNHVDLVALDNILNGSSASGNEETSPSTPRKETTSFLTAESLKEIRGKLKKLSDESLYKDDFVTKMESEEEKNPVNVAPSSEDTFQYTPCSNVNIHTTNSLESRSLKYKDASSAEWHLRRKSYGFEKMSPPDDKSMFQFEHSTDSGLGRSSDLGNWSPTTDSDNSSARATVITFGEQIKLAGSENKIRPIVHRRLRNRTQPQSEAESAEMKRHSIAVDESQYVRENLRKTSAVHLSGFYSKDSPPFNDGFIDDNSRRQKRVEFCKTEVHFAAESGRVNIVETDGKPPPSNNFRRRRRSSSTSSTTSTSTSSTSDSCKTCLPVIHFGDEHKSFFDGVSLDIDEEVVEDKRNVTVSIPFGLEKNLDSESRDGDEHQDEVSIRGILKNKPVKPKPYHLGENIESSDALWGVQLKPVATRRFSGERDQTEEDFKEATVLSANSVADRIRIVEERREPIGYSTKINLNLSNSNCNWTDKGSPKSLYDEQLENDFYGTGSPSLYKMSPPITDEALKSTPLIIQTLRSANQFDEAMRRLSISSNTSSGAETATASVTTKHVSSLSHITKAGNVSSLNGDYKASTELSSYSYHSEKHESRSRIQPPPRLKVVGSTTNSVCHQLSQLRRMYDCAGFDSDDSARADEEVKGYFGDDLDDDEDAGDGGSEATELSGSWSRLEDKRNVLKIQTAQKIHEEAPKSNVMNIELHSTFTPTVKKPELIRMLVPVAKPRTSTNVKQSTIQERSEGQQSNYQSPIWSLAPTLKANPDENLKILKEARGARKLREHELSYFGVKIGSSETSNIKTTQARLTTNSKRSLPSRKLSSVSKTEESLENKWSLPNEKPDLLRHSPILVESQVIPKTAIVAPSIGSQLQRSKNPSYCSDDQVDGIYVNIQQPTGTYCRRNDLERDEKILSEMTKTADQTMKDVSDEAAQKDLRRRSISRRSLKPLETIDEKFSKSITKPATRSKTTTAHRVVRECSNRPSSASSGDSLPITPTAPRSRSKSRENVEYANVESKPFGHSNKHRSSSGESRRSVTSSTEDIAAPRINKLEKRSSTKDETLLVRLHHNQQQRSLRNSTESRDRHKVTPRSSTRDRVGSHDPHQQHSRSHRSSNGAAKFDGENKRSSQSTKAKSKSSTTLSRNRTEDREKNKSSTERVSHSKGHSMQSDNRSHRVVGSKTPTLSSSGGINSDTLIQNKNDCRPAPTHSSSLKITTKRLSKDRK